MLKCTEMQSNSNTTVALAHIHTHTATCENMYVRSLAQKNAQSIELANKNESFIYKEM